MNTYRYDIEQRKAWVLDKWTRMKTVRQICQEAFISRATLYNWLEEFKDDKELLKKAEHFRNPKPKKVVKSSRPELISQVSTESIEHYKMLVSAIGGIDYDRVFSKKIVAVLIKRFTLSVKQACAIVGMDEEAYGYKPRKPEVEDYLVYEALVLKVRENRTIGFDELYEQVLNEHPDWTRKQMKRVYRDGMIYLERNRKKGGAVVSSIEIDNVSLQENKIVVPKKQLVGGAWKLNFIEIGDHKYVLYLLNSEDGSGLNAVEISDLSLEVILNFLNQCLLEHGQPKKLVVFGLPEFSAREITKWVWEHKMALMTLSLQKPENQMAFEEEQQKIKALFLSKQSQSVNEIIESLS